MGPAVHAVEVGDLMAFRGAGRHNVTVMNCEGMDLTGVTITSAGSFAVLESGGDGRNHYIVTVKRGPRPAGASVDPLFSSSADAFHSVAMRHGPIVEDCYFESTTDDGIAIHGAYSFVFAGRDGYLTINRNSFREGDPLRLFDLAGRPAGEAVVRSIARLADFRNERKSARRTRGDNTGGPYWEVTLDKPLAADFDFVASNPHAVGSGYILRRNTIRNHRARGLLLKADDGLVENNTIEGSTIAGIVVTPEFWWNEACYSRNVTIRNNTIRRTSYIPRPTAAVVIAAIEGKPIAGHGHHNIVFENNTIEDIDGPALFISSADGVVVRNNRFVRPQAKAHACAGAGWGMDCGALMAVAEAVNVRLIGNRVEQPGAALKQTLQKIGGAQVEVDAASPRP
jgi:hypothetical protein